MEVNGRGSQSDRPRQVIRFGPFQLDCRAGELRKHGLRIRLQEKPLRILQMLVERPGEPVLRDEIQLRLWPNNTIVEFDHSINAAIKRLRDALGESADEPRYVETLARRGYRFIGQLEPAGSPISQESGAVSPAKAAFDAAAALRYEEPSDLVGRTVCQYRVLEVLGSGGMGVVYRAEDLKLGRAVALKFLSEELLGDPDAVERFEREARTASALSHPNICSIFGVDLYQGRPFIAMELAGGETLAARLGKGPLPIQQVFAFAISMADALAAAHARGVIHRDLKPENVMVTKSTIKLLDFGIARILASGQASAEGRDLTRPGIVPGTLRFASPEQLEGKPADARSDIFSFGLLLYQMLTGRHAFNGNSPAAVIGATLHLEPALDDIPEPLRKIVVACLAKDPDARWQSARDLKLQLESMSAAPDLASGTSRRTFWSDGILIVAGVSVLLVLMLLALFFHRRPAPEQPLYHVMISTPRLDLSNGSRIALSRDGRRIAFVTVDPAGARHLGVRSLESDVVQTIASATDARNDPFWSPDGHFIGYFTSDSLKTVDLASGQVRTLARTGPATRGASWGANDQVLFTMLGPAAPFATIHAVPAFGGEAKQVTFPHRDEVHMYPYFLPDGRRFLFSVFTGVTGHMELRLGSLDNRETRSLGVIAGNAVAATPSVLLFRRAETLFAQRVNPSSLSFVGDAVPIVDHIRYYAINGFGAFSASENGVLVFRRGGNTQTHLRWFDRVGKPLRDVGPPGPYWSFDLSRDETRLAATKDDPVLGLGQVWTGDADRAALTRLTSSSDWEPDAAWSSDGQHLAYIREQGAQFALMLRDENGVENQRIRLDRPQWLRSPAWSPDGRFLAVAAGFFNNSKSRVMLMDSYGASPATDLISTKGINAMPQFSPDGRWIAYVSSEESDRPNVYIRPFPDVNRGKWLMSADGGVQPRWRADGREMFYLDPTNQVMAVPIQAAGHVFQIGKPVQLFQANVPWNPGVRYEYAVSQDGQRILACVLAEEDDRSIEMLIHWNSILR